MQSDLTSESSDTIAIAVREELARRRLSRQWLADEAQVSLSTLEKALSGRRPFTLATVVRLEDALGVGLRAPHEQVPTPNALFAPEHMGAYARPAVQWLEGDYLTVRPSFSDSDAVFTYKTSIAWDEAKGHLTFSEGSRLDSAYEQKGFVSLPNLSGAIYLVTISEGQYRVAIFNRPAGGSMSGILLTLAAGEGAQLTPAAVPICLLPAGEHADVELGVLHRGEDRFDDYRGCIDRVRNAGFARFPG